MSSGQPSQSSARASFALVAAWRPTGALSRGETVLARESPEPARHSLALEIIRNEQMVEMLVIPDADEADDAAARLRNVIAEALRDEVSNAAFVVLC